MLVEGQIFDQYRIVRQLKSGGMGEVYLANDTRLPRQIAIKVIRIDTSRQSYRLAAQEATRLFLREAQAIARLDHLHILPLYGSGEIFINGMRLMYMVMPFRQEGSLIEWLNKHSRSRVLPLWDVERIINQAASALQHAHNQQIIHQDVKPSNFLIQGNAVRASQLNLQLADFGVAKFMPKMSESQVVRGTPDYMAPEQWKGRPVPATDQYALAVMAYELLTGYLPFTGANHEEMWHQHHFMTPEPPSHLNPSIPEEIDNVLLRALSKKPSDRFGSIEIFARAFRQAISRSPDIYQTLTISPQEARMGTRRVIIFPGRRRVRINVPAGVQNGQILRLEGSGKPSVQGEPAGALIITIDISDVPDIATVVYPTAIDKTVPAHTINNDEQPQPHSRTNVILKIALVLLMIALSSSVILYSLVHQQNGAKITSVTITNTNHTATSSNAKGTVDIKATTQANETSTDQAGSTATDQAVNNSATATANAQTIANAQATANVNATATAQIISANATATAYVIATNLGHLALSDPLQDNSKGYKWDISSIPGGGGCAFTDGAYHSSMPQTNSFAPCFARSTNFSDFAYEVQMTIIKGDQGGIIFRASAQDGMFYYFHINRNGMYALETMNHFNSTGTIANGTSSAIKTGLNQTNLLAIVAQGSTIELFVNRQMIASVPDTTYIQGQIGVIAESTQNPTEVVFSGAEVWSR